MRTGEGEEGTSSAVAFAVAGVLFIGAISTVLVYANDRIPPPAKSAPHDSLAAEARVLVQVFVMSKGNDTWTDGTGWSEAAGRTPGLVCDPVVSAVRCSAGTTRLDRARLDKLVQGKTTTTNTYTYDEVRTAFKLVSNGRHFHLSIANVDTPTAPPLWTYGPEPPDRVPTRPAVVYAKATDGTELRVSLHVFA